MSTLKDRFVFNPTDFLFAIVKLLAIFGSLIWGLYYPMVPGDRLIFMFLLAGFFVYTLILYIFVFLFPEKAPRLYLLEFILDLIFLSFVIPITGGMNSPFVLALILIAAVQSFYFGLIGSVGIGLLVSAVMIFSSPGYLYQLHWADILIRTVFLLLLSVTLGYLSERERRIHRQLVNAEQLAALGLISSQIAHAVRNPLSTISLSAELLSDELKKYPGGETKEAGMLIDSILKEVGRVNDVVEEHLKFMRKSKSERRSCDINGTIESLVNFLEKEANRKGISFMKNLEANLRNAKIGESQLRQIILNVIRNSFDAMPRGGQIRIYAKEGRNDAEITIEDTGVGISREDLRRIFDPFFTTKDVGTGLGLYIARDIVLEVGGGISCDSKKDRGTTVRIRLPFAS